MCAWSTTPYYANRVAEFQPGPLAECAQSLKIRPEVIAAADSKKSTAPVGFRKLELAWRQKGHIGLVSPSKFRRVEAQCIKTLVLLNLILVISITLLFSL